MTTGRDLHLLGEQLDYMSPKECVSDSFEPFRFELHPKMVEYRVRRWRVFAGVVQRRDWSPVGGCADEDLVDVLRIDFSVVGKIESNFFVKLVDEEVNELVLVDFAVCLLVLNTPSAGRCPN